MTTFDTFENSNADGIPVRLYEISYGNDEWLYNSSDRDIVVSGKTYLGIPISDNGFQQNGEAAAENLTIRCPVSLEIVRRYRGTPPSSSIFVKVRQLHYDDVTYTGGGDAVPVFWIGTISGIRRVDEAVAEITASMLTISFKRGGLRLTWVRSCPHFLYDANCRVSKAAFAVAVTATATATTMAVSTSLSAHPDGYFSGGFVEWADPVTGTIEMRGIESHVGQNLVLLGTFDASEGTSASYKIYPGCKRTIDYCNSTFNNRLNYGGVPQMPGTSPFDGNPIY